MKLTEDMMGIYLEVKAVLGLFLLRCFLTDAQTYSISGTKSTAETAHTLCNNLASPCIVFTKEGHTIDIEEEELDLSQPLWVGYVKAFAAFAYRGCYHKDYVTKEDEIKDAVRVPNYCFSFCNSRFIGITDINTPTCHCSESHPDMANMQCCGGDCVQPTTLSFVIGSGNILAVYEKVDYPPAAYGNRTDLQNICMAYEPHGRQLIWKPCSSSLPVICQQGGIGFILDKLLFKSWKESMEKCVNNRTLPADLSTNFSKILQEGGSLWIGIIRNYAIFGRPDTTRKTGRFKQGHIKKDGDGDVILSFTSITSTIHALCGSGSENDECPRQLPPTPHPATVTNSTTITEAPGTTKMSTNTTTIAPARQTDNDSSEDTVYYAVIPVVLIVVAVGVVMLICWRRRNNKNNTDDGSLTMESNINVSNNTVKAIPQDQDLVASDYLRFEPVDEYATIKDSPIDKMNEEDYDTTNSLNHLKDKSDNIYNHLEKESEGTYDHTRAVFNDEEDNYNHTVQPVEEETYDKTGTLQGVPTDPEENYSHIGSTLRKNSVNTNLEAVDSDIDDTYNHLQR